MGLQFIVSILWFQGFGHFKKLFDFFKGTLNNLDEIRDNFAKAIFVYIF